MRRVWLLVVGGAVTAGVGPAGAGMPDDLAVGTRVEVEGRLSGGTVRATEVEVTPATSGVDQVEGRIDSVDPGSRRLVVAGVSVSLEAGATLSDDDGLDLELSRVEVGSKADAKGSFVDGVFRAREIEVEPLDVDEEDRVEFEGAISAVDPARSTFRLLGTPVRVEARTKVEID